MNFTTKQRSLRDRLWYALQLEIGLYTNTIALETYLSDLHNLTKYVDKNAADPYLGRYFTSAFENIVRTGYFDNFERSALQKLDDGHSTIATLGEMLHRSNLLLEASLELQSLIISDPSVWQYSDYLVKLFDEVDPKTAAAAYLKYHARLNTLLQVAFNNREDILIDDFQEDDDQSTSPGDFSFSKKVVFLSPVPLVRITKLRDAIKSAGITVELLAPSEIALQNEYLSKFDSVTRYNNLNELWRHLENTDVQAVHSFATSGSLEALAAYVCVPDRFVYDVYDVPEPGISAIRRVDFDDELSKKLKNGIDMHRVLINQSRGICTRSIYPKAQKTHLPDAKQTRIFIPECCIKDYTATPKLSESDGKLHIVHGGSFLTEKSGGSPWSSLLWLAERAIEFDVHFHLYAMPWANQDMSEYEEIDEHSSNFHNHGVLAYDEWMSEISKYDIGLFYIHPDDEKQLESTPRAINPSGAWSNKINDYIDAGLYTIISEKYRLMAWYVSRYGIGQGVTLDQVLEKSFWSDLRPQISASRENFLNARKPIQREIIGERLSKFYESL